MDKLGFDEFVTRRAGVLWQSAWYLTGDRHKAEDLVQTALARTYGRYSKCATDRAFEVYLRTTMYRVYCSWWRRKWNAERPTAQLPETHWQDQKPDLDLRRALAALPKMQRAVLVLRYFEDRTIAETAQLLGISAGSVKTHASRGIASLRLSLKLVEEE
ncbi:SigE family RNA polymerase sigma factor [Tessaracoccus sp. OH4464_COT-324]|uniref:SigE family RNA polymerase sigma factor n=1 Tax=Tessaracoccus sp. OH4464_COT-324 TaxID=2491059 RepID=UPI000F62E841|nr:SigE family RNA polymerase sigma factor [Tessaracoccus sp. OH4464_COT-324]RRD46769.1 SigE family RNA polymerase sigma factor [Tessaracoccus sp. OH4464_COT-324]